VKVLVYEFASGGGLSKRDVPPSIAREGAAMRAALVADLAAIGCHEIVTTADARVRHGLPRGVEVVPLPTEDRARAMMVDRLILSADAVWLVAPETDGCLEQLAARVERQRKPLLGSSADAIRRASDKACLPHLLSGLGVRHPETRTLARNADPRRAAGQIGYPIVVKPAPGAGSHGLGLARDARELGRAVDFARRSSDGGRVLLQEYVRGAAASVSLLANGRREAVALTLNAQAIGSSPPFSYRGGETPFDHPLAKRAIAAAIETCRALPGLRGFVGVDLVLTESDVVVIEVNPRLTTAYLGVRAAVDENVAALALAACVGDLPSTPRARRHVRFSASGRVVVAGSARAERGAA
jgi:predicted ATP-grasp superfamily ATP-dependent carboligase